MRILLLIGIVLASNIAIAQSNFTETEAKQLIDTFFEGFHDGDTTKMRSVMIKDLPTQTVYMTKDGMNMIMESNGEDFIMTIGKRPADQQWEERILDYKVQIDGNLAHVWTPYEFWFNGEFSHCGANAFTLAKTNTGWKIIHLIDSRRRSSCTY